MTLLEYKLKDEDKVRKVNGNFGSIFPKSKLSFSIVRWKKEKRVWESVYKQRRKACVRISLCVVFIVKLTVLTKISITNQLLNQAAWHGSHNYPIILIQVSLNNVWSEFVNMNPMLNFSTNNS